MSLLIFLIVSYIVLSVALYFLFPKAGVDGIKGAIPGVNFMEWCELIGRPKWWAALLLIPIVNIFIYSGMAVDLARSFGKYKFIHSFLAVVAGPLYFLSLAFDKDTKYVGKTLELEAAYAEKLETALERGNTRQIKKLQAQNPYKKGPGREWAEAIIFAVFAATFIRMFLIEAYVIPTPSMEGTLLVGDFLFVSKAHYGIRTPKTVAMLPLVHNRAPIIGGESYLEEPSLAFRRLPALETIDRNDQVVFNYPEGDSVYVMPGRTWSIHDFRRGSILPQHYRRIASGREELVTRPIDKRDHYIKRCVAVGGDSIRIVDRQLFINGKPADEPQEIQHRYIVNTPPSVQFNLEQLDEWGVESNDKVGDVYFSEQNRNYNMHLSQEQKEKVQAIDPNIAIEPVIFTSQNDSPVHVFPHSPDYFQWTRDNFGPLWIPEEGATIDLTERNMVLYERVIKDYEHNELEKRGGQIFINGAVATTYTFQQNYYWMMGDNRHNSEDSRIWGFVPKDHIVGKPLFIWMSAKEGNLFKGIRFNRLFRGADSPR